MSVNEKSKKSLTTKKESEARLLSKNRVFEESKIKRSKSKGSFQESVKNSLEGSVKGSLKDSSKETEKESGTKELILESAKAEFLKKGFHEASLRTIVERAGVTTGSFYWYFKNKEDLFEALIGEHYRHIMKIYKDFVEYSDAMPIMERMVNMKENSLSYINEILEYMYAHIIEFKILISASVGTRYENFLHEMVESKISDTDRFTEELKLQGIPVKEVSKETEHILISGMFTSVFELVTHEISIEKAKLCMKDLVEFYTAGWFCLMNLDVKK